MVFFSVNFLPARGKRNCKLESVIVSFYIIRWFVLLLYFYGSHWGYRISPLELDRNSDVPNFFFSFWRRQAPYACWLWSVLIVITPWFAPCKRWKLGFVLKFSSQQPGFMEAPYFFPHFTSLRPRKYQPKVKAFGIVARFLTTPSLVLHT